MVFSYNQGERNVKTKETANVEMNYAMYFLENALVGYFQASATGRERAGENLLESLKHVRLILKTSTVKIDAPAVERLTNLMKSVRMEDLNNADVIARHLRDEGGFHPWNMD